MLAAGGATKARMDGRAASGSPQPAARAESTATFAASINSCMRTGFVRTTTGGMSADDGLRNPSRRGERSG